MPDGSTPAPWTLPEAQPFDVLDHVQVAMPDGVRLSLRLWLPQTRPAAAVLEMIPYRKHDLYRGHDDAWGAALASRGIAYARADVRGSGESEGVMTDEYSQAELADGEALIAWLAAQPWSNGAVGMRGISWGGINTLQIAARRPPALKAIMPFGTCDDRFTDDAHYVGGALGRTNFQWGVLFKTVMAAPPNPAVFGPGWETAWRERLEATPPILERWLSHQRSDAYWRRGSVGLDLTAIACPTYVVGGWADTYVNAVDRLLRALTVPRKGLVGPWGHTYPWASNVGLDWAHEEVRWWRHWLMGEATGIMDEPMLRVFLPDETTAQAAPNPTPGRWIAEPVWPPAQPAHRRYRLGRGALTESPEAHPGTAAVDGAQIVGLAKREWLDRQPNDQADDDARSVVFETAPLADDVEILGAPALRLRLSADRPVAQVAARLCAVAWDGSSWLVAYALRNLAHRTSHDEPAPLVPGEPVDLDLKMAFVAHRFRRGQRIRLAISESLWPLVWPSPECAVLTLDLAGCRVDLPVRAPEAEPAPLPIPILPQGPGEPRPEAAQPGADGRWILAEARPAATAHPRGANVAVTRQRTSLSEITPGDPASAHWAQTARSHFQADGFDAAVEAAYDLTASTTTFHLVESVKAWKDGLLIFERETRSEVARDLL